VLADDFLALPGDEFVQTFSDVLQAAWGLHRKPGTDERKQKEKNRYDENLHRDEVGNGSLGISWRDVQHVQKRERGSAE